MRLVQAGKDFTVATKKERALALYAARFAGAKVTSREIPKQGFKIFFLMKTTLLLLAASICGCATQPHCVLLKFNREPSAPVVSALAATQNEPPATVAAWFQSGERGFVLAATHTNEISLAVADGATVKGVK